MVEHIIILKEVTAIIEYRCHEKVTWSSTMYVRDVCQSSIHTDGRTQSFRVLTNVTPDRCMSVDDVFCTVASTMDQCLTSVWYHQLATTI